MLGGAELIEVSSDGEPGDKSRFVRAVEQAVLDGRADIGVHSAKDLPGEEVEGLEIVAVPPREDPADAWIGAGESLQDAPEGARVGTVSLRRKAQLLAWRPDLRILDLNGNVDTRLRKLAEGDYDAIILAAAGLRRLGREGEIGFRVPEDRMVPAAGQGALAIQVRTRRRGNRGEGAGDRRPGGLRRADRRARLLQAPRRKLQHPDRRPRQGRRRATEDQLLRRPPRRQRVDPRRARRRRFRPRGRRSRARQAVCSVPAPPSSSPEPSSRHALMGRKPAYILGFRPIDMEST